MSFEEMKQLFLVKFDSRLEQVDVKPGVSYNSGGVLNVSRKATVSKASRKTPREVSSFSGELLYFGGETRGERNVAVG